MNQVQVLERFHRALIEEIQSHRPEYLTGPFTVAEIYQNLVPYGSHRDRIGVEMNADYEDALLRLLAGEGGYLQLESEPALRDIRAELETTNPNTGLYREFAAVDVRLGRTDTDGTGGGADPMANVIDGLDTEVWVPSNELAPAESGPEISGIVPPAVDIFATDNGPVGFMGGSSEGNSFGAVTSEVPSGGLQPEFVEPEPGRSPHRAQGGDPCVWCTATLPDREGMNFCPYCGTDLKLIPCPSCGDEVEPDWRFCVACGTEVRE